MRKLRYHTDPGHGWLQVPRKELLELGVEISKYSYMDCTDAFLEQDSDMPKYLAAAGFIGEPDEDGNFNLVGVEFEEVDWPEQAAFKQFARYKATTAHVTWNGH
tara:strand:+ start:231 stop:542 length:312 start_codon:yes stop_codon:yes gene_type:complete